MTNQFIIKFEEKKKSPPEWTGMAQNKKAEMLAAGEAKGLYSNWLQDSKVKKDQNSQKLKGTLIQKRTNFQVNPFFKQGT